LAKFVTSSKNDGRDGSKGFLGGKRQERFPSFFSERVERKGNVKVPEWLLAVILGFESGDSVARQAPFTGGGSIETSSGMPVPSELST
jgi:hypothetical protein